MAEKIKYALPGDEHRKEMTVITECWSLLQPLSSDARDRVINWLQSWSYTEKPSGKEDFL